METLDEMKTYLPKVDEIERKWVVVDAKDQVLGRMAVKIADTLRGKNKPTYTPHLDCGDFVVVINAAEVALTGRKETQKVYQSYTGYMGGLRETTADKIREKDPCRLVRDAVWGMLPKGRLGRAQFRKLKVYAGAEHPHEAQTPEQLTV
jgi:large subunit ribosomal protein L13